MFHGGFTKSVSDVNCRPAESYEWEPFGSLSDNSGVID